MGRKLLVRRGIGIQSKVAPMVSDERRLELNLSYFSGRVQQEWDTYNIPHPNRRQRLCRTRMQLAVDSVCHLVEPGGRILDVGCGTGAAAVALSHAGYQVTAVDMVGGMLERAQRACSQVNWLESNFGDHVAERKSFDAVLSLGYLEYQERAGKEMVRIGRLLKPGGYLLLSVPNTLSGQFGMGLSRAYYRMSAEPEGVAVRHSYTPERLQRHLGMAGYILMDYQWLNGQRAARHPLALDRPRDFWRHRVGERFAPEMLALARTYRKSDTQPVTPPKKGS